MGTKPAFLIVGPQKTGTTALFTALAEHPQISAPAKKELHFFNSQTTASKNLTAYFELFPECDRNSITFEATPNYFADPTARWEIYKAELNPKIICILRDPVERFISQYVHFRSLNIIQQSEALQKQKIEREGEQRIQNWLGDAREMEQIIADFDEARSDSNRYFSSGEYIVHLKEWFSLFGRENIYWIDYNELYENSVVTIGMLLKFLNLTQMRLPAGKHNRRIDWIVDVPDVEQTIRPEHRAYLADHFKPLNQALYEFLKHDFNWNVS